MNEEQGLVAYRTLRGALSGSEPNEENYFAYKATLRIFGEQLDFEEIQDRLELKPTHCYKKGEPIKPNSPPSRKDFWSYTSDLPEDCPLEEHIDLLWTSIKHAKDYLRSLKKIATVDVFLGYRSNVDTAGVEIPHTSLEMYLELEIPFGLSIVIA